MNDYYNIIIIIKTSWTDDAVKKLTMCSNIPIGILPVGRSDSDDPSRVMPSPFAKE